MLLFEECTSLYWQIIFGQYVKLISTLKAYDSHDAFLMILIEHVIFTYILKSICQFNNYRTKILSSSKLTCLFSKLV